MIKTMGLPYAAMQRTVLSIVDLCQESVIAVATAQRVRGPLARVP
jgi:hypothetical protein